MKVFLISTILFFMLSVNAHAQHRVSGTVTGSDNKPIAGAVVQVKATTISVVTNAEGYYTINAPTSAISLIVSAEGAISVEIPLNARTNVDIKLGREIDPSDKAPTSPTRGVWNYGFSGNINTRLSYILVEKADPPATVLGSWLTTKGSGDNVTSITNGFAPAALSFNANTQINDNTKINIVISSWFGLATSRAITEFAPVDVRQIFAIVSNRKWGAVKFGRDYGLWAQDQRSNDVTLVGGNGGMFSLRSPGLAHPGGNGAGYIFNDRLAQIDYISPLLAGIEFSVGAFNPMDFSSLGAGAVSITGAGHAETNSTMPGFHGKIRYTKRVGTRSDITLVTSAVTQKNKNQLADFSSWAVDWFARVKVGGLALSGYYYVGSAVGTGGFLTDVADLEGNPRDNDGGYAQIAYEFGEDDNWVTGVNWGVTTLGRTAIDPLTLMKANSRISGIIKHKILNTIWLTAEYTWMQSENHGGGTITNQAYSVGAFLGF